MSLEDQLRLGTNRPWSELDLGEQRAIRLRAVLSEVAHIVQCRGTVYEDDFTESWDALKDEVRGGWRELAEAVVRESKALHYGRSLTTRPSLPAAELSEELVNVRRCGICLRSEDECVCVENGQR